MIPEIAVVGSINLDISVRVGALPRPGETVLGADALWSGGGKGANQAVGAARLGRRVAMVGSVGADSAGRDLVSSLADDGIDVSEIEILDGVSTGLAMIEVDDSGENSIVVSPGANSRMMAAAVEASAAVREASLVLVQFEIPEAAVEATARAASGRLVINPAPARLVSTAVLEAARVIIPNEGELATLAGGAEASGIDELVDQARSLGGGGAVIVTMGAKGALVVESQRVVEVPAKEAEVVDTTAAGDSFCAAVADALVGGETLTEAARWAVRVAGVTVSRRGAQYSLPKMRRL